MATEKKNFCKKGTVSKCEERNNPKEQEKCAYYDKASYLTRCMYLRFDKFCDSLDAQLNTKNI